MTSAYLVFFTAQYVLEISGVLACCGAGVMLAWLAPPIILSHETMHNVWGMMEWVLNTLIFLMAGLIIGNRVLQDVAPMDWLYVVLLYIILMVVRAFTIALLYPWISTIGHKCTRNEAIFMSWAGLRGVSLPCNSYLFISTFISYLYYFAPFIYTYQTVTNTKYRPWAWHLL